MVDPSEDFSGYMDQMASAQATLEKDMEMLRQHEIWRQTTWGGYAVRTMQSAVRKIEPLVTQFSEILSDSDSASSALALNVIRLLAIAIVAIGILTVAKIVEKFVGSEIYVEEEVIILHEDETEEEASSRKNKTSRGKKEKRQ